MLLISMVTFLLLFWLDARSSAFSPILLRGRATINSNSRSKPSLCKACKSFNSTLFNISILASYLLSCLGALDAVCLANSWTGSICSNHLGVQCFRQSTECLHLRLTPPPQVCLCMHGDRARLHANCLFLNKRKSYFAKFESRFLSCPATDTFVPASLVDQFSINNKHQSLYVCCRELVIQ